MDGKVVGVHDGIVNFTIGQRKGIKVSNEEPFYVIRIDAEKNEIYIGPKEELARIDINLKNSNLLTNKEEFNENILVKVRSTGKLLDAKVNIEDNDNVKVSLLKPEYGISPGQACVFYKKDQFGHKVLGGGWIKD